MKSSLVLATALAVSASANVPSLSSENYESMTDGKTVFLKFFAPWCGHCKAMAPDWEKLADKWAGHEVGFIGEVDCTAEGKDLCETEGIQGFPTLKYGDPSALDDYSGGRSYDDLEKFADENLKPICSVANIDLCDDEKKSMIEGFQAKVGDDLDSLIATEEKKIEDAESNFKNELENLQATYERLMKEKEETIAQVKAGGLGLMKSVRAAAAKTESAEL
eukprot:CAMPEP_0195510108 /NCGR_PEP_ID=MMETSP0794_2-20130614/2852_1 /TAXON_ID=515487 /ORGANISM="Stephanopyxis turris, Strain CCMP 815" /LENGTH=219 /DNA_ID=CAMNT_0040637475 /DNA_START=53 /DNA_END=712 /DNA_ORIENTATION=-